jgi:hypothetical protein
VVTAALNTAQSALDSSLSYANKALTQVATSAQPPDERVTTNALTAVTVLAIAIGAFALMRGGRKAA